MHPEKFNEGKLNTNRKEVVTKKKKNKDACHREVTHDKKCPLKELSDTS